MKQLHEFENYAQAVDYTIYKAVSSNKASQFFGLTGMKKILKDNVDTATEVEVIPTITTTIGSICETVLDTLAKSEGHFELDPGHSDGALNYIAMNALVDNNVFTQSQIDAFISLAQSKPYESLLEVDYNSAIANKAAKDALDWTQASYLDSQVKVVKAGSVNKQAIELHFDVTEGENVSFDIQTYALKPDCLDATVFDHDDLTNYDLVDSTWRTKTFSGSYIYHLVKDLYVKNWIKVFVKPSKPCTFTVTAK